MTPIITETSVLDACRTIFGADVSLSREFLFYLQPSGAKTAFRKIAKETHPDLFAAEQPDVQKRQNEQFRQVLQAYELLNVFFKRREGGLWVSSDRFSTPDLSRQARRESARGDRFYRGDVPRRILEIGLYLYYRGSIPYRALIDALVWQRGQRPVMGDIAKRWSWLDEEKVKTILDFRGRPLRFGEKAVHLGYLTPFHIKAMLWYQRSQQERLGQFFLRKGYLSPGELEQLVRDLNGHNAGIHRRANAERN